MHPFQENVHRWLSRNQSSCERNRSIDIPFVLSTNVGLVRKENQDRVAALYTGKKSANPVFVVAVADGMGGMRDGGECATLALSSFFHSLIQYRGLELKERSRHALLAANSQVYEVYKGSGGSTLTAVLVDMFGGKVIVHVGDSRVYSFIPGRRVERNTTDDSLVEAVGGSGRELLQFVGMGDSIQPHVLDLVPKEGLCAITTDGIHGMSEQTMIQILGNSSTMFEAAERLESVSMWCGGADNATSAIFDVQSICSALSEFEAPGVHLWDAAGGLTTLWLKDQVQPLSPEPVNQNIGPVVVSGDQGLRPGDHADVVKDVASKPASSTRRSRKRKKTAGQDPVQLDIEIGAADK